MLSFKEGYENFIRLSGANLAAGQGAGYVSLVEQEIEKLAKALNESTRKNLELDCLKGFAAEIWHEGTFNIDAVLKGRSVRAFVPDDNGLIDILLPSGERFQLKYYKSGGGSAKAQALSIYERYKSAHPDTDLTPEQIAAKYNGENGTNLGPGDPYYSGQIRLIPKGQLENAKEWLKQKIAKESGTRPEEVKRYQEALDNLTENIKSNDGVESIPLSEEDAKLIANEMKKDGFDPAEFGLSTEELVGFDYVMREAFSAGLSAMLVSVVLKVAPEICGIILKLIKEDEVNAEDFKRLGLSALKGGAEGYVRGTVAAAITISCKAGLLGGALKTANPSVIGTVVAITMNTVQNACLLAFGKIDRHDFAERCAQDLIIAAFSLGAGVLGAAAASAMFTPSMAVFGYMIGSFVGSVVGSFAYKGIHSCAMSFCVESGGTFFGLVEQNYELPEDILNKIGVKVFEYESFKLKRFEYEKQTIKRFEYPKFKPIKIDVTFLKRGVISVGAVGYVT